MARSPNSSVVTVLSVLVIFFLLTDLTSSSFISDDIFGSNAFAGRSLLQTKKSCPDNFEFLNYTIITSQCKGPKYPANLCCAAFKELACPYAADLNDISNDCATTLFSYINLYGKYPPGLFSSECREGKEGLACPAEAPESQQTKNAVTKNGGQISCTLSSVVTITVGLLVLLVQLC
ncbi:hypothetical protein RJ641_017478 [Dillenia turbinata]|uniref:GPI-anchored protein LLG1-like domain-containing protein n=1 Tax=Dillenia turbinata TaxID=194707 RepID=A0AAN8UW14_9MAGN